MKKLIVGCDEAMERFYSIDKGEKMPFSLTLHLIFCKKCRSEVRLLTKAEKSLKSIFAEEEISEGELARIMEKIGKKNCKPRPVSMANWMFGGILLFASALAYKILSREMPSAASISAYAIWGAIFTAYCGVFVESNLDFFVKKSRRRAR